MDVSDMLCSQLGSSVCIHYYNLDVSRNYIVLDQLAPSLIINTNDTQLRLRLLHDMSTDQRQSIGGR